MMNSYLRNPCFWVVYFSCLAPIGVGAGTNISSLPQPSATKTITIPKKYAPRLKKEDSQQLTVNSQRKIENKYLKELSSKFPVLEEKLNRLNYGFKEVNNRYIPNEYYDTTKAPDGFGKLTTGESGNYKRNNAFASFPTKWGDEINFAGKVSLKPIVSRSVILTPEGLNREEESRLIHPLTTGDSSALPQNDNAKRNNAVLIYENAFPNTDVIYAAGPNEIEEFYYVRERQARSFNYELQLKDNLKEAKVLESGELVFSDNAGAVALRVSPPIVFDSEGRKRQGRFQLRKTNQWERKDVKRIAPIWLAQNMNIHLSNSAFTWAKRFSNFPSITAISDFTSALSAIVTELLSSRKILGIVNTAIRQVYTLTLSYINPAPEILPLCKGELEGVEHKTWNSDSQGNKFTKLGTSPDTDTDTVLSLVFDDTGLTYPLLVDPTWTTAGAGTMANSRYYLSATLLPNGKVLIAGGKTSPGGSFLSTCELYDPNTGQWTTTGSMATARRNHTATLLPNGKVLVAGGFNSSNLSTCELYDPNTGQWTTTGSISIPKYDFTATLLPNGKVLVAGGFNSSNLSTCELYDLNTGQWTTIGSMVSARTTHTATLLPNGKVLIAGGANTGYYSSCELYDPSSGTWSTTGSMSQTRSLHITTLLPNGKVLAAGGYNGVNLSTSEFYDPSLGTWSTANSMATIRQRHSATLLPDGKVLVAGGENASYLSSCELYDPASGLWSSAGNMSTVRSAPLATLLPNGKVLATGGYNGSTGLSTCEVYNPGTGSWTSTGNMSLSRSWHTATLLPNGKVLVTGRQTSATQSCEIYNPDTGQWTTTGSMITARLYTTAKLLPNGKVLVMGGWGASGLISTCELYDPGTGSWATTGSMSTGRDDYNAVLLSNGNILVISYGSSETYNPDSGIWSNTATMNVAARRYHTATLLPSGKVLVTGGWGGPPAQSTCELYDPTTNTWTTTGSMSVTRRFHTTTLLPNGTVLVTGGSSDCCTFHSTCQIYNPSTGNWAPTGSMATTKYNHSATLLPNGKVLVSGGSGANSTCEIYDPATGTWTITNPMSISRYSHTATLLVNGKILVASGGSSELVSFTEYAYTPQMQPNIITYPLEINRGQSVTITGERFTGISEGSGGNYGSMNSPANYPRIYLQPLDSGSQSYASPSSRLIDLSTSIYSASYNWSTSSTTLSFQVPVDLPYGYYHLRVISNAIPSDSKIVLCPKPPPPNAPTGLVASFADGSSSDRLKLNWLDNATSETGFTLERSTDNVIFNLVNVSIAPDTTYYIDTGPLLANTTYWHRIYAFNAEGNSAWATSSPFTTRASVPGIGSTTNIYISSMTVGWGAGSPANPTGTTYSVERATSSDFGGTKTAPDESGSYTATFQNLTLNTTYYFRVKARNHDGVETTYNTSWLAVTRASSPTYSSFGAISATSIQANWLNGSPPNPLDTDYVCEISTISGFGSLINQATTKNFIYTFPSLVQNSTYYLQVKAVNHAGISSDYVPLGSAKTSVSAPSGFQLTGVFPSSASFTWVGGLGSNGYRIEAATSSNFGLISRSSTTTPNELGNYVTGLNPNTLYYSRVGNLNMNGVGTFPAGFISTATLAMIPGLGSITDRSGISLTATWGANSNPLGTSYVLEASTYSNFSFIHQSTMVYATTGTVSGLSPNTVYYMQAKARNLYGNETGYTNLGSTTTMLAPPANTQFSGVWYSSATLSWDAMTANGYVLDWSLYPDFSVTTSSTSIEPGITSLTATGLDINATYYFKVGSKNALNETSYTSVMTTATLANQPIAQPLSNIGPTTITANWGNNNNPPGTSYQAQASTTSNFGLINQITTPNELGNYTGLISQTTYYLRVRAVNHSGIPTNWVPLGSTGTIVTILVSTGTYTAPSTVLQNNEAAMFKLTLATDGSTVNWNSLTLQQLGTASDADIEEIRIYKDNAPFGTYDGPGTDYGVYVAGARFTSGTGTVYIVGGEPAISATPRDYFVVLKLASAAQINNNIQIRLAASSSLGFSPGMWQVQGQFPATSGTTSIQDNSTVVNLTGTNMAPTSISKGTSNTALLKIRAAADTGTSDITSLILTRTGTATNGDVSAIKIFKDADSDGVFDPPGSGAPDTQVNTLDASGFSGPTELVTFDTAQTVTTFPSNFFVVVDIPVSATTDNTLGVRIAQGTNVNFSGGADSANGPFPLDSVPLTITDVPNTLTATISDYPAPASGTQGEKIGMLKFSLTVNAGFARWRGLRVDLTGSEISSDVKEAQVYWDADTSGAFSAGDGLPIATATFQGGLANLTFSTQTITSTPATYFLVYHINPAAIPGNTLTAKIFDATYLTITTPNTTVSGSFPLNSGTVTIQPTLDTVTVMPGSPQPAPASVVQGDNNVSLAKLRMSLNANAATFTGLRLDKTGGCVDGDVSAIKIWRDANTSGILESGQDELISSGLDTFFNNLANVTLNIPQNIPLTPSYQDYFVSMSFSPSATYGVNCGLNLATSNYVMLASPDRVADSNFPMSVQTTLNEYPDTIYIATTSITPSAADPGTPNVPMLKLVMNTGFSGAPWRSVQFDRTGTATSSDLGLIKLWLDRNANGTLDVVQDAPTLVSAAFPAGSGPVVMNINPNETLNVSSKTYFVTADITAGATPNRQFGLLTVNNNYFLTQSPNTISTTTTTGYPAFPFQSGSVTINEPPSEVTAIPISLAPSEVTQDFQNVPFMYLSLRTNNYTAYWTTLKLDRTGNGDDGDISRIRLYADDGDGSFEPTTQDTLVQTGNILVNNNQATLSFSPISITKTDKKFFLSSPLPPKIISLQTSNFTVWVSHG